LPSFRNVERHSGELHGRRQPHNGSSCSVRTAGRRSVEGESEALRHFDTATPAFALPDAILVLVRRLHSGGARGEGIPDALTPTEEIP
jgi:hypothetical protein